VLETEEKLFEAKVSLLDSTIQYQKGLLELELIKGSTLTDRGLDMTKPELQEMTQRLLAANRFGGPEFDALKKEIQQEYILKIKNLDRDEKSETFWERTMK
jgi:outer membrane translocation and assembly module TamA